MKKGTERRAGILTAIAAGRGGVAELASAFGVSPATIRRDLTALERNRSIIRTHGGATAQIPGEEEDTANHWQKEAIAQAAIEHINEGDILILDGGSTVAALARRLKGRRLRIITNSIRVVIALADDPGISLFILGGSMRMHSLTSNGPFAEEAMRAMTAAKFFTSADGLVAGRGLCEETLEQISLKRLMIRQSSETFVLADSSKLGHSRWATWVEFPERWTLITDDGARQEQYRPFEEESARISLARALPVHSKAAP